MGKKQDLRACLTSKRAAGYDDSKPRSQLAFGRLLGFIIGEGDPSRGQDSATKMMCRLFTGGLFTAAIHSVGVACERHRLCPGEKMGKGSPVGTERKPCGHGPCKSLGRR